MSDDQPLTMDVNLADLCAAVAATAPDRCALVCNGQRLTYRELTARSEHVAQHLIAAGIEPGETVGLYLPNSVAYVESLLGCMVARAIPVNINYRYTGPELAHLFGGARLAALVVDAEYAGLAAQVAPACPALRHVLVAGGDPAGVSFPGQVTVLDYASATSAAPATRPENGRSGDDRLIIYTGGTTGLPKGVLWRHEDFYFSALAGGNHYGAPCGTVGELVAAAERTPEMGYLLAVPLMHGSGTYTIFTAFLMAAKVVITRRFDPARVARLMAEEKIMLVAVVGDAMARPLADELAARPGEYDLSSWLVLGSGGALLSPSVRAQLLAVRPELFITDRFGSSETGTDGQIERGEAGQARLIPQLDVCVVDEHLRPVPPGQTGWIAKSGHVPLGYFGDQEATARTFPSMNGKRWAILGDLARVEQDGSIIVLGRGSTCINTGGEKVFPEEVEQALKSHPAVLDALVAGVPDERYGKRVAAVVELRPDAPPVDAQALRAHCRAAVAGYKVPTRIHFVPQIVRSPSGKADYRWARRVLGGSAAAAADPLADPPGGR
ncbi:MAG TPA: AMP-binding protein [Streptosporangiaceae bacterium]|nr:AMP-binding protein [Streptosporangiaceae bacterium]